MPNAALFSSASDNWPTPADFYSRLDVEFDGFTLDVCSSTTNHKAPTYYALDHPDETRRDGLTGDWTADAADGAAWMNPPYGRSIEKWMRKAHDCAKTGTVVVCLVPVRASSAWWHDLVLTTGAEVRYIRGRLTFGDAKTSAPFASAVVIYRPDDLPGQPGPVGVMYAKTPLPAASAKTVPSSGGRDSGDDIASYIEEFTPKSLDEDAWQAASGPVRELVAATRPVSVAQARLHLSALSVYLADPATWDRQATPDLTSLLSREAVNAHLNRVVFKTARTKATRRDTLYRLGRALGTIDPTTTVPSPANQPDAFLLAGATQPVPVAELMQARAELPGHRVDALKHVVAALRDDAQTTSVGADAASTVMAWDTIRVLTESPRVSWRLG